MDNKIYIITEELCAMSVCAPNGMSREEIEREVNAQYPTGIKSLWRISGETHFKTGQTMPCQCEQDENRQHWLFQC